MPAVTEFAPAKVNLTLHVTGQRGDGYHLLDSLVVFAEVGDQITVAPAPAPELCLSLTGPMAGGLQADDDNLVLRAARLMGARGAITLEKCLPVSSGIGGGSADAAATLRALARLGHALPPADQVLRLGADVPVCLAGRAVRMQGVGEQLTPLAPLPAAWLVLANPGVSVATPAVFKQLACKENAPMPGQLPRLPSAAALATFVQMHRNDLEAPAMQIAPVIAQVKKALSAQPGCLIARMSGSGATCFGLFADRPAAEAAARAVGQQHPQWWVQAGRMLGGPTDT